MLPVLVVAAAVTGSSATAAATLRRRRWLNSKPQRRFKLCLTDNSDAPFQHLTAAHSSSTSDAPTSATGAEQPGETHACIDHAAASEPPHQHDQHQQNPPAAAQEQLQQHPAQPVHPYAEQIAAVLQHPRCPDFSTAAAPNSPAPQQQHQEPSGALPRHSSLPQAPPSDTPCLWVDTPRKLQQMLRELQGVCCIALDTEHNSQRSYLGVLCLLQLSTGYKDYLVDALALHDHLPLLRPLLADPSVLKVLHGGANDIGWLQRDAHVYLVNVFDTEKAAQALGREERSLAHLLRRYCGVAQDKTHQTADWRLRPLAPQLQQYARSDVHWLPYLAGLLVGEMQARSPSNTGDPSAPGPMLTSALQKSNSLTLKLYAKPAAAVAVSNATAAAMRRYVHAQQQQQTLQAAAGRGGGFVVAAAAAAPAADTAASGAGAAADGCLDEVHLMVVRQRLAALVAWRDAAARADDEGPQYILPDAALLDLVAHPPSTAKALLSLVQQHTASLNSAVQHLPAAPHWAVSSAVRKGAGQLVRLLQERSLSAGCGEPGSNQGLLDVAGTEAAAAAGAAGGADAAAAGGSAGLPLMVNGQLVQRVGAGLGGMQQQQGQEGQKKKKKRDREKLIKKFSAKTQVYDNCRMLSTSGELLCYCDARKLQWYLDKGLAEMVVEEPPTIRLLFEHKNADQQVGLDGFYSTSRANRCVVCGCEEHYLRYRVVPACYRRCFPIHLKSHRSHDIVLLCLDCHQAAHKAAEKVKRDVAAHYGIPLQPTYQQLMQQQALPAAPALQQQQQPPADSDGDAAADGADIMDEVTTATAAALEGELGTAAGEEEEAFLSAYHRGDPKPVSGMGLVNQARAAAVALVRFGGGIPAARRRQLELLVAQYLGKELPADASSSSSVPLVTPQEIEAALLAGLGERKRAKTLQKLRKNLKQLHAETPDAAAEAEAGPAAASSNGVTAGDAAAAGGAHAGDVACSGRPSAKLNGTAAATEGGGAALPAAAAAAAAAAATAGSSSSSSQLEQQLVQKQRLSGREEQQGHLWHGQQVVAAAMAHGGEEELHRLVQRFRQVFVLACKPKYLPAKWAVDAVDTRQFGEYSVYAREETAAAAAAAAAVGASGSGAAAAAACGGAVGDGDAGSAGGWVGAAGAKAAAMAGGAGSGCLAGKECSAGAINGVVAEGHAGMDVSTDGLSIFGHKQP